MQHLKLFFQLVLLLMVVGVVVGMVYAWFSFIFIGALGILTIMAFCGMCKEIWKDIRRKFR